MNILKKYLKCFKLGKQLFDNNHLDGMRKTKLERNKKPKRTEIINFLLSTFNRETSYLEIGVRNPMDNFNHIKANKKYGVDPGLAHKENPVDFSMTSDEFFSKLKRNEVLSNPIKFDVIFIDGLHFAEQVDRDITNSLEYLDDFGFIVLHDCNPPTEWHSRENYNYHLSPAEDVWNGTTWKAFIKWRSNPDINSCCLDTDWGIGILSKNTLLVQALNKQIHFTSIIS